MTSASTAAPVLQCLSMLAKLTIVAGYFWSFQRDNALTIHHSFAGTICDDASLELVSLQADYPWDGKNSVNVSANVKSPVHVCIPGWAVQSAMLACEHL